MVKTRVHRTVQCILIFWFFSYTLWRLSRRFQGSVAGLIGCLGLAFALAPQEIAIGLVILLAGILFRSQRLAVAERKKSESCLTL
jgi:hypothetical protein